MNYSATDFVMYIIALMGIAVATASIFFNEYKRE